MVLHLSKVTKAGAPLHIPRRKLGRKTRGCRPRWTDGTHLGFLLFIGLHFPHFLPEHLLQLKQEECRSAAARGRLGSGSAAPCFSEDLKTPLGWGGPAPKGHTYKQPHPHWPRPQDSVLIWLLSDPTCTPQTVCMVTVVLLLLGPPGAPGPGPREKGSFSFLLAVLVPQFFIQGSSRL